MSNPHLLLDWHLDCNTGKLTCELLDGELVYEAHSGGVEGYTKTYKGKVTKLINKGPDWHKRNIGLVRTGVEDTDTTSLIQTG